IATLMTATATSLPQIIAWRFAQGLVTPGVFAVAVAYIHDRWEGARAATTTAAYVTGTVIGGFVGRVASGQAAAMWGWRASFVTIGAMSLACAFVLARTLPHAAEATTSGLRAEDSGMIARLTTRRLLGTYAAGFC